MNVYTYQTELANNGIFGAYNYPRIYMIKKPKAMRITVGHMYLLML